MDEFNHTETQDLLVCAFRYALGRRTYITATIADLLIKHKDKFDDNSIHVILRDIKRAFETNKYGMEMDKADWERVLDVLSEPEKENKK